MLAATTPCLRVAVSEGAADKNVVRDLIVNAKLCPAEIEVVSCGALPVRGPTSGVQSFGVEAQAGIHPHLNVFRPIEDGGSDLPRGIEHDVSWRSGRGLAGELRGDVTADQIVTRLGRMNIPEKIGIL